MTGTCLGSETAGRTVSLPRDGGGGPFSPFSHRTVFSEV